MDFPNRLFIPLAIYIRSIRYIDMRTLESNLLVKSLPLSLLTAFKCLVNSLSIPSSMNFA